MQATGTFDFSAPAGGLSFPPPSFGASSNNPFAMNSASSGDLSGNESDSRADTTGEEAARAKRPFRGFGDSGTQQSSVPFQISNPTGQAQQANLFAPLNAQEQSGGALFSFGGTSQPGINFNNTPTQEKPAGNIFSFGASSSQPAPSSPSINFGSGMTQDKPGNNIFSFGQQAAQPAQPQATNSGFNFGSPAAQEKPTTMPFSFGQGSATPSSSGNNFGSTQTSEQPATNLFGSARPLQDTPATNIFGSASQQPATTSNLFTGLNAPASPSNNLFALQTQNSAPASNGLFGGQSQQPAQSTLNVFASSSQAPATSNVFAEQKSQPAPTSNLFGNLNNPPATSSNLFSGPPPLSASNLFGGTDKGASSASDLFGNPNKPINQPSDKPEDQPKANGSLGKSTNIDIAPNLSNNSTSSVTQTPSTGQHGGSKPLVSHSDVCRSDLLGVSSYSLSPASSLYGRTAEGPPVERVLNRAPESNTSTLWDKANWRKFSGSSAAPVETSKSKSTFSFESAKSAAPEISSNTKIFSAMKPIDAPASASQPPPSGMFPSLSKPTESPPKPEVESSKATAPPFSARAGSATNISSALINRKETLEGNNDVRYPAMVAAVQMSDESMAYMIPARFNEEQRQEFYVSARMRALNKAMQKVFGAVPVDGDINGAMAFYRDLREQIKRRSSTNPQNPKRKVVDDENQENENPSKRSRQLEYPNTSSSQITREETASAIKGSGTPSQSQPYVNGASTPKAPPSAAPQLTAPPTSPAPKGKRKAEVQLTKDDHEAEETREARQIKTPRLNGGTGGSNTSNIFKNILDSPTKASPAKPTLGKKMIGTPESSNGEALRFNPFGNLPVPSIVTESSNPSTPANMFAPKPTSTANPFQLKPAASGLTAGQKGTAIKPPTFGSVQVDFLQQFGQKAKDSEEKLMKAAKEEDMDSDEDEAEWEAKYHEKRRAELKAIDDVAKSKRATFVPGKGFTYGQIEKRSDKAESDSNSSGKDSISEPSPTKGVNSTQNATGSKSLFGQNTAPQSSGNSIFGSLNGSRTSTPGPFTSPTGSVLDGHKPGKPMPFGNNIFSHLSDSGADSGKGDDGDDDSGDGDSDAEEDSENKDPSYQPDKEIPSSPSTPAEETGPGIASAKKANIFSFGSSKFGGAVGANPNSGTSSPGGSIFDRISKDSDGKPIRHVSTEEKENTQPSTTVNVFADTTNPFSRSFTQSSDGPADKTWKPSTPIKFSSAMPNNGVKDPAPTVSVTEATPTKVASPFANLFGNSGSSKPTSSLTAAPTSAGVGFGFGNPSSTTSSLFPSAAASTTTSRATSPGGTTDGDSAAEGDPDPEQHEQIDLTKGGIGEENEEVIHEVRAKAIKFSPKEEGDSDNPWETKGVGPLRVLKHRENNAARILLRADPSGTIVLNKGILPQVNYEAAGKTLKLLTAGEGGKSLETWILQVKTPELAKELATVLESNKKQ